LNLPDEQGLNGSVKITIAGSGAMGCRFGAALFAAGHEVLLLDGWAEHVEAINRSGLRVTDEAGTLILPIRAALLGAAESPAADQPAAEVPPAGFSASLSPRTGARAADLAPAEPHATGQPDLVIVFAKATGTAAVAAAAAGAIGPATFVLTLQNGLGNVESLLAHVPAERLLAGTTTLGTELLGPGHIRALGSGDTVFGPLPGAAPADQASGVAADHPTAENATGAAGDSRGAGAERVRAALAGAGISVRVTPNALEVIWAKVAFNCVMNTLCSIASIPVSALARYDGFDPLASSILDEIAAVARAEGVTVDTAAALATMKAQFDPSASGSHLASMLQDLMNGRRTEIAHLNGAVAARAAGHGIDAPANALIAALIGLLEATWPARVNSLHAD
jgi:2-dehydropantoate 2-reductase